MEFLHGVGKGMLLGAATYGMIEFLGFVIFTVIAIILCFKGILPALYNLGNGLSKRKIAILAGAGEQESLKAILVDSKLFKEKNICSVYSVQDLGKIGGSSLFLVYWPDWSESLQAVLDKKRDGDALVVYAPRKADLPNNGEVPTDVMVRINNMRNSTLTNFRGRLLNDIVSFMITTSKQ